MPLHPPSTLYDRVEEAKLLSDEERAQLNALAEELWREMDLRVTRARRAGLERAFWSLISEWESLPAILEDVRLPGTFGLERVRELEDRLGETLIGNQPSAAPGVDLSTIHPDEEVLYDVPRQLARRFGVFPIRKQERLLELACANPRDWNLWLEIAETTAKRNREGNQAMVSRCARPYPP